MSYARRSTRSGREYSGIYQRYTRQNRRNAQQAYERDDSGFSYNFEQDIDNFTENGDRNSTNTMETQPRGVRYIPRPRSSAYHVNHPHPHPGFYDDEDEHHRHRYTDNARKSVWIPGHYRRDPLF